MYATRFLDIPPLASIGGTVRVPGSKSISNRVLLLAGFAAGPTAIDGLLDSDDTRVMLDAMAQLGCAIGRDEAGTTVRIDGLGERAMARQATLMLGNSGTSMRSLAAALAVRAAVDGGSYVLAGVARMHERPIGDLVEGLRAIGCPIDYLGKPGFPPLRVGDGASHALDLKTPIRVRGNVSSQFLTGLLQALCLVRAGHDIVVEVEGELISKPYVAMTVALLERFGVSLQSDTDSRFVIPAGSELSSPGEIEVEGDASSATYLIGAGAIAAVNQPLRIEGVGQGSIQGDIAFIDAVRAMGAEVDSAPGWIQVRRGRWPLAAIELDCNHMPDAAMTLAALALYAEGTTRINNIASWRVKETDRIAAMSAELRKLGAATVAGADFLAITPPTTWRPAVIATYDDHRMAMAMSLAAFNPAAGAAPPVALRIVDPHCVAKTWPDYFETLFAAAATPRERVPVLTIDGPTASGKGTLASAVAQALGYRLLDSGALYRASALAALERGVDGGDEAGLATLAAGLDLSFAGARAFLAGRDVTEALRLEAVGALASRIAAWPAVRTALNDRQLAFRVLPGLVADGRDMGSVVFADAELKVFLTASAGERAERRHKQLISKGISANIADLRADLEARDARDRERSVSPLKAAEGALLLDNSALSIEASVDVVLRAWEERRPFDRSPV